jgi:hypothetical protein
MLEVLHQISGQRWDRPRRVDGGFMQVMAFVMITFVRQIM